MPKKEYKQHNLIGIEITEEGYTKAKFEVEVNADVVLVSRGLKDFAFNREDIEKILKEGK